MPYRIVLIYFILQYITGNAQDTWNQISDMPFPVRCQSITFSMGKKGYVIGGQMNLAPPENVQKDIYVYDPLEDIWTQINDFPRPITEGIAFTIGSKAYVTTGRDSMESIKVSNLYIWDSLTGSWEDNGTIPSQVKRTRAVGFSVGSKGYITTGLDSTQTILLNDLWEYDPETNYWTKKSDFPGIARYDASCFVINGKAYITNGWTFSTTSYTNDLWEYDPETDIWQEKEDFPGAERNGAISFSIGGYGYILGGSNWNLITWDRHVWKYHPPTDQWYESTLFPGTVRIYASSFILNEKAYITPGWFFSPSPDSWEYHPTSVSIIDRSRDYNIYPNPVSDHICIEMPVNSKNQTMIQIMDLSGRIRQNTKIPGNTKKSILDVSSLETGLYFLLIKKYNELQVLEKVLVVH